MLPLTLLKTAENHPMLIELKNGDTYNGRLVSCNMFMNICLRDVICTSRDGDRFWKIPECYIRGNSIKYLRIPDEVVDLVSEDEREKRVFRGGRGSGRLGRGEGRGEGGRGGGRYVGGAGGRGAGGRGGGGRGDGGRGDGGRGPGGREGGRGHSGRDGGRGRGRGPPPGV